jgi:hypothetical protein
MTSRLSTIVMALSLITLVPTLGCDDADQRSLDLRDLPERFACDDVTVVATTEDASQALLIGIEDGLAAAAFDAGETVEAIYTLPDDRLTIRFVGGSNVVEGRCGHEAEGEWRLDERLDAVAGTIHVRLTPKSDDNLSFRAELHDLVFEAEDGGESITMPLT